MDELATFLRTARENAELTQWDLAKPLGYSTPQFVSNWERGVAPFPVEKSKDFIKLTKCSPSALRKAVVARYEARIEKYFVPVKKKSK